MDESAEFPDLRVTFLSVFSRPWAADEWWHGGGNIYCTVTMTSNTEHRSGFPPLLLIFSLFGKAFRLGRYSFSIMSGQSFYSLKSITWSRSFFFLLMFSITFYCFPFILVSRFFIVLCLAQFFLIFYSVQNILNLIDSGTNFEIYSFIA